MKPSLRVVNDEPTVEDELRSLLRARDRLHLQLAKVDSDLLPHRRQYAKNRGEFMLPTIERLRRELL